MILKLCQQSCTPAPRQDVEMTQVYRPSSVSHDRGIKGDKTDPGKASGPRRANSASDFKRGEWYVRWPHGVDVGIRHSLTPRKSKSWMSFLIIHFSPSYP